MSAQDPIEDAFEAARQDFLRSLKDQAWKSTASLKAMRLANGELLEG